MNGNAQNIGFMRGLRTLGWVLSATGTLVLVFGGCSHGQRQVVVYTALDQVFSEPLFRPFERQTGVSVRANYDTEAFKTVGLFNRIRIEAEGGRNRCDLFWNNEILNTLRLKRLGLLRPIHPPNAAAFPDRFRDRAGTWYGFAARARVLLVNTDLVPEAEQPRGILELIDGKWRGKVGMAKPLFGTTATHAVCLFVKLGGHQARDFFRALKGNGLQILPGNKQVALAVSSGQLAVGFTDTDDAIIEVEKGRPVRIVYPDSGPDAMGTLFIPNTVAALKDSPHPQEAEQLANYLLSPEVERTLAQGPSAQIPLNPNVKVPLRVETPATIHAMDIDFEQALDFWDEATRFLAQEFGGP